MTLEDVEKLAKLARIEIPNSEKQEFLDNLESILKYVGQIQEVSVGEMKREVGEVHNVMREDGNVRESGIYTEKILAEAPAKQDGYFKVKKIL